MIMKKLFVSLAVLLGASSALAQNAYPLFEPADGILVGDQDTYVTTPATSADVRALWSGTCSISTFLRGDGACAAAAISGAALTKTDDTNVTLTLGGSPSTALVNASSLTLGWTGQLSAARGGTGVSSLGDLTRTNDTNVTLTLGGTPTGSLINSTSLTLGWTGTLGVSRGGIGVGTLTGIAKGNGTSAFSAAASSDVIGLWTGTCNSGTFLRADGTCQAVGAGSGSVTSISQATGITATPNPITTTGSIGIDFTGNYTWTGTGTTSWAGPLSVTGDNIRINSTDTYLDMRESDAGADGKVWWMRANGNALSFSTRTDAGAAGQDAIQVGRSGTTISSLSFGNATGNPTYSFLGTGAATFPNLHAAAQMNFDGGVTGFMELVNRSGGALGLKIYHGATGSAPTSTFSAAGALDLPSSLSSGGTITTTTTSSPQIQVNPASGAAYVRVNRASSGTGEAGYRIDQAGTPLWYMYTPTSATTLDIYSGASGVRGSWAASGGLTLSNATGGDQGDGTVNAKGLFINGVAVGTGGPTTVFKASATDRSSTTALATDPDLVFTSAASAVYKVEFCLVFGGVSTGTQGFKFAFNKTAAGTDPGMWGGFSIVNGSAATTTGTRLGLGTGDTGGQISYATISVGNQQDSVCGSGQVVTNGTSSYGIQWAQNSSSGNATRLGQGSFIQYQRIN